MVCVHEVANNWMAFKRLCLLHKDFPEPMKEIESFISERAERNLETFIQEIDHFLEKDERSKRALEWLDEMVNELFIYTSSTIYKHTQMVDKPCSPKIKFVEVYEEVQTEGKGDTEKILTNLDIAFYP